MKSPKECKKCGNEFIPESHFEKYCHNPCTPIKSEAEKWLDKKPNIKKRQDSNAVAYSFFRKKYGVKKKYKVMRG